MLFPGTDVRTRVYVDGFNLYYGALKGTPCKWLDPVRLAAHLLPRDYAIDRLRYFTARVLGKLDPQAPARQQNYLKALATLPQVDIHYGRFLAKTAWRPLANLPVAGRQIDTPRPVMLSRGITGSSVDPPRRCRWASIRTDCGGAAVCPVVPGDRSGTR